MEELAKKVQEYSSCSFKQIKEALEHISKSELNRQEIEIKSYLNTTDLFDDISKFIEVLQELKKEGYNYISDYGDYNYNAYYATKTGLEDNDTYYRRLSKEVSNYLYNKRKQKRITKAKTGSYFRIKKRIKSLTK